MSLIHEMIMDSIDNYLIGGKDNYMPDTMTKNDDPRTLDPDSVQHILNGLGPEEVFKVIFLKLDGSQRQLTGHLIPSEKRSANVVMQCKEGFRQFNINRVLHIST